MAEHPMTGHDLEGLRGDAAATRRAEVAAFLHAVRPIAGDLASTLLFTAILAVTGSVTLAVVLGIALGIGQAAWMLWRGTRIAGMQWVSLSLVVVMGGATLITHDPRFVLVKISLIYTLIGAAMLEPGWIHRYVPPIATRHIPERWVVVSGFVWAGLMLGTGLLNLALTFTIDARATAAFMTLWAPGSKIALFAGQYLLFRHVARRSIIAAMARPPDAETQ